MTKKFMDNTLKQQLKTITSWSSSEFGRCEYGCKGKVTRDRPRTIVSEVLDQIDTDCPKI